jgi:hypothetical protein
MKDSKHNGSKPSSYLVSFKFIHEYHFDLLLSFLNV